jgi:putative ABC transport system permease protein
MVLTFPAAKAFGSMLDNFFPIFLISTETLYYDIFAAVIIALCAAIIPAIRAIRIRIADGLRRIG